MYVTSSVDLEDLEPDVLERLSRSAVEVCRKPVVAAPRREVASCDPGRCAMAGRTELLKARLRRDECRFGLVEVVLFEQRATEHELRIADLVEVVLVALEQPERVLGLLGSLVDVTGAQVDLRERR